MKLSTVFATVSAFTTETRDRRAPEIKSLFDGGDGDRRYFQLTEMMSTYNADFDERKYWNYGCNCHVTGDRPMSDPGFGPPVDSLDKVCKEYKDCVKCARLTFGDTCIGEFVQYKFSNRNGEITCRDKPNTCGRALCECDHQFAQNHVSETDVFDPNKHYFFAPNNPDGTPSWDPKNNHDQLCPRNGGSGNPQCCSNEDKTKPFFIYNAEAKTCCQDGTTVSLGEQCSFGGDGY